METDYLREMLAKRSKGLHCGLPSYCTANELVIEACLQQALRFDCPVLIEATANQVNQYGGYTGMTPQQFQSFVHRIAERIGFPTQRLILGGDHLGPLIWAELPEAEAMARAKELVDAYVTAGFQKIHLDTSMKLADDRADKPLQDEIIAGRGARLYAVCEKAYQRAFGDGTEHSRPVYIIGSEVPIPGGAQQQEESVGITKPEALLQTISAYREAFERLGLKNAFENIIGVVVQPGVEFGDNEVFDFDASAARALTQCAAGLDGIVLEGHSTDYQTPQALRQMVDSGIAILKVGPALTFALREALFALSSMERILVPAEQRADFPAVLERTMLDHPAAWQKHYHGVPREQALKRAYSYSDRCRYYLEDRRVAESIEKLLQNMSEVTVPMGLMHQYMPVQYQQLRSGHLYAGPRELVKSAVAAVVDDYNYAVMNNYFVPKILY